ncbi:gamma-crystallin M1-like [Seriola aureovittata]|uniref:gamma-crystallin M1-like n=1 Tax=Seriola aureovittata TaxID=2871759 RepID=UPI0024BE31D1|nr:gamma-crystallin M1-like [Seriola aureovittata]
MHGPSPWYPSLPGPKKTNSGLGVDGPSFAHGSDPSFYGEPLATHHPPRRQEEHGPSTPGTPYLPGPKLTNDCILITDVFQYRGSYRMRIYERENFGGQMSELMDDCDNVMDRYRMSNCMSCHVMDGHWLMYEQPHYRGRMMYMRPGEYRSFMNMGMGNMKFMSMKCIMDSHY